MSEDVLDQSDIDSLLAAVDVGEVEESEQSTEIFSWQHRDPESVEIRTYDFKRPERVSKDQMRALQTLHEGFARNFGAQLSGFLRTIVEVKLAMCEQMTYGEFICGLPNPTSFNLIEAEGLEGQICLEVSPLIIYPIIDRLLGGSNTDLFIPPRPMTLIETKLIGNVTNRGLDALSEAWESVRHLEFKITASESNPQLVQIVPPNEVVVVIGLELKMGNRAGTMNLCIPYNAIEPIMANLSAQNWFSKAKSHDTKNHERQVATLLTDAPVKVTGLLAETTITMEDLANITPGDIIITEKDSDKPAVVCVEGERKYLAALGQYKGRRALRITREYHDGDQI